MKTLVQILCFLTSLSMVVLVYPKGVEALLLLVTCSAFTIYFIRKYTDDKDFITYVFLAALCFRILLGIVIETFGLTEFMGGDSITYDSQGYRLVEIWYGIADMNDPYSHIVTSIRNPGWGMIYLTAIIYWIMGKSLFVAQTFCAVVGAATVPMVYFCAKSIYNNRQVARNSALLVAFFPAFIIWSGQLLKDGLVVFLLVLAITMILNLQKRFNYLAVACLMFALFGILSLRFYIFYLIAVAIVGSFIIGTNFTIKSFIRGLITTVFIGLTLTYLGVTQTAVTTFTERADLEKLQSDRKWAVKESETGFGEDFDVSTPSGIILALPIGFIYLLFAPFPWAATNFRQAITIPEVLLWWSLMPMMVRGISYTLKYKLRASIPVIVFTLMLTLLYSISQSNVGTAFRQRTQIQVFLVIFIAVGWSLNQEKKEDQRYIKRRRLEMKINKEHLDVKT